MKAGIKTNFNSITLLELYNILGDNNKNLFIRAVLHLKTNVTSSYQTVCTVIESFVTALLEYITLMYWQELMSAAAHKHLVLKKASMLHTVQSW